jgi:hypothetical protein
MNGVQVDSDTGNLAIKNGDIVIGNTDVKF